jgi:hypothetical protein
MSAKFIPAVWGICALIVGKKATYAKVNTARAAILPVKSLFWKKMKMLIKPIIQIGMKIDKRLARGLL